MYSKRKSYQQIALLIERFADQIDFKNDYNEIYHPLFKALELDIDNSHGNVEVYGK